MIYICIPAHNEERTAGLLLWKVRKVMSEFGRDYTVLFLDDASTDQTAEVVAPYAQVMPLELRRHERRQGHGASLEALLRQAVGRCGYPRRDAIVTLQADFTEEPEAVPGMIKRIEGGADLVVAAGSADGDEVDRWVRKGLAWLERKHDWPEEISDPLSGLRAYRVSLIKRALEERNGGRLVKRDGWAASLELLLALAPLTDRIEETQVEVRKDRRARPSRMSIWRTARDFVGLLREGD